MYEELFEQFEKLRRERWGIIEEVATNSDDIDDMLADICNTAILLYISRKSIKKEQGFVSFNRRK